MKKVWLIFLFLPGLLFFFGCSGSSHTDYPFPLPPFPTTLEIFGVVDFSNVALHPNLGGIYPGVKHGMKAAVQDLSTFQAYIEDDPTPPREVDSVGKFSFVGLLPRNQIVLRFPDQAHPGLLLEWMGVDPVALIGSRAVTVTVTTTARSFVARALRNNYGRLLDPQKLTDAQIKPVAEEIYGILEKHPEKLSAASPLDRVPEVASAVASIAAMIDAAGTVPYVRDWTILVYQGADNSLVQSLLSDINEMKSVKLPGKIALVVQIDTLNDGIRRLFIEDNKEIELVKFGPGNSADTSKIYDFITWGNRAFPARRTAFIMASHGLGWRQADLQRGVISDDSAGTMVHLSGLGQTLTRGVTQFNGYIRPFDLIGFDACLMGLLETSWQLRKAAKYLVVSEANEPGSGWPYDLILKSFLASETIDGEVFGKRICDAYKAYYEGLGQARYSGTLSVLDLQKSDDFMAKFAVWAEALYDNRQAVSQSFAGLRDALVSNPTGLVGAEKYRVQAFEITDYRDLRDLVDAAKTTLPLTNSAAEPLLKKFPDYVKYQVRFGEKYSRANGLSISVPGGATFGEYSAGGPGENYFGLDFAADTRWDEFLQAINATQTPRVDGRGLKVEVRWNTAADLDLYFGEPDPVQPENSARIIWSSPNDGPATSNGQFSPDSSASADSSESWTAKPSIIPGQYYVFVNYFSRSTVREPTDVKVKIKTTIETLEAEQTGLTPGDQFEVAKILVKTDEIIITPLASDTAPEAVLKGFEKFRFESRGRKP